MTQSAKAGKIKILELVSGHKNLCFQLVSWAINRDYTGYTDSMQELSPTRLPSPSVCK